MKILLNLILVLSLLFLNNISLAEEENSKDRLNALIEQGAEFGKQGKFEDAIVFFNEAVELAPNDADLYYELGYVYEASGNFRKALDSYEKSIELDDSNAEVFYNLGNIYYRLGLNTKASESFTRAVGINPKHKAAWYNLSVLAFQEKDFAKAVQCADNAIFNGMTVPEEYLDELEQYR